MGFQKGFVWGGASASYQIEGGAEEDGKGLSVWDMFCRETGRIRDGRSGAMACDHYHRYREDVALMKLMGLQAYRFSISWPRVIPAGYGKICENGMDFYDRLVDALLEAGIVPYVTLFHWDYPYDLFRRGGWLNPDSPGWFSDYVEAVANRLGDRVKHFITLNEPQCFIGISYADTVHAPGVHFPVWDILQMAHHVLLGHGLAVQALRAAVPGVQIGIAPTCSAHYPATEKEADIEAARRAIFDVGENWTWSVSTWSDPILFGRYPEAMLSRYGRYMPSIGSQDMKIISQPIDFYGQNIYNGCAVRSDGAEGYEFVRRKSGYDITASKWPVTPQALYWGPKFLYERYRKPFYITENGISCPDVVSIDGKVHDPNRKDFLYRYLREYKRAAEDGVDARGYFQWCVTDNFEWEKGYTERFGLVYCDFETQKRIPKDSAFWFRDTIRANGENLL